MARRDTASKLLAELRELEQARLTWDNLGREIQRYICPERGFFIALGQQPEDFDRRGEDIIDGTASRAMAPLAAGMQGGLTSPSRPWFRLAHPDEELMEYSPVREWIDGVERAIYRVYLKSNFYSALHVVYQDEGAFGTACLHQEEDPRTVVRFNVVPAGEYALAESASGEVDTVFRRFHMTAVQMVNRFGREKVSDAVARAAEDGPHTRFEVVHAVKPRRVRQTELADGLSMAWSSIYLERGSADGLLSEGGYRENPYHCPRWSRGGVDVYGRGPGHAVLGDVKMLQEMQRSSLEALHKMNNPPLRIPMRFKGRRISLIPGGRNYDDGRDRDRIEPILNVRPDTQGTEYKIERVQRAIERGFYSDVFLMLGRARPGMTATEVAERHEEKLLILGPVIERQIHELLDPCLDRTFNILARRGMLPPVPPELEGADLKVEYISLLAQAQKMIGSESLEHLTGYVARLAQLDPAVRDKFNAFEAAEQLGRMAGVPPRVLRSQEEIALLRQHTPTVETDPPNPAE